MACTTILVGKKASWDGSTIIARNEDSGGTEFTPKKFIVVQPEDQPRHYVSHISHAHVELPDNPMRYTALPDALGKDGIWAAAGVNTANVAMSATETITANERLLGADPLVTLKPACGTPGEADFVPEIPGGLGEEDFVTLVLPYINSAREGVERLGALLEEYGTYEMNGIAFSDINEIWWLETIGGHHWIAKRVPDDSYVTMPNQLGIDSFDMHDAYGEQEDHMCSKDLWDFMEKYHLDLTLGSDGNFFNPRDAFGTHSERDHIYNTCRAWYMQRHLNPSQSWDGRVAAHGPASDNIPWDQEPERKLTIEDINFVLSSHYEGTVYDPYDEIGNEEQRRRFRPIGINRESQSHIIQLRGNAPAPCRAVEWLSFGSNAFNTFTPYFANIDRTPAYLADTTALTTTDNHYWANRIIAALADAHFKDNINTIDNYVEKTISAGHRTIIDVDEKIAAIQKANHLIISDDETPDDMSTENAELDAQIVELLEQANEQTAANLKEETYKLLDKVLYTTSLLMRNAFKLSDH